MMNILIYDRRSCLGFSIQQVPVFNILRSSANTAQNVGLGACIV